MDRDYPAARILVELLAAVVVPGALALAAWGLVLVKGAM